MTKSFNLVDQPFIPCLLSDGNAVELGIRDCLLRAHEIRQIRDDSPLVTVSLHRLLLAILHRNFGPATLDDWARVWSLGRFDQVAVDQYLAKWHDRFDLCHGSHPFYQRPLAEGSSVPVTRLALVQANNATLFDHRYEESDVEVGGAEIARWLVAYQTFAIGGGVAHPFNYCHSPVVAQGGYLVLILGRNLFETLWLNAVCCDRSRPMPQKDTDKPAWERDRPRQPDQQGSLPEGYLDYLTWQSRQIHLMPSDQPGPEGLAFSQMRILQGLRLSQEFGANEPMAAYVQTKDGGYRAKPLMEGRSLWRDSHALLQELEGASKQPRAVTQLAMLRRKGVLPSDLLVGLSALGLSSDQAKVSFWRHETMPLPLALIGEDELVGKLKQAVEAAEAAAKALYLAARKLGEQVSINEQSRMPDKDRVSQFVKSLDLETRYWAELEVPFRTFLQLLPGDAEHQGTLLADWRRSVCGIARSVFTESADGLESSPRTYKALYSDNGAMKSLNVQLGQVLAIDKP